MPSARFFVAVVGHTSAQGGSSQCMQPVGTNARCTSGYVPNSRSSTRRHCTPGGVALACLHAAVHVWQPTQRRKSATMAQRVIAVLRRRSSRCLRARCPRRSPSRRSGPSTSSRACSSSARRNPSRTASPNGRTGRSEAAYRAGCPAAARRGRARRAAAWRSRSDRRRRCRAGPRPAC